MPWSRRVLGRVRCFRITGNDPEIAARSLIGLGGALLPIPERAERNLKASGKFLLRETERAPDQLGARRLLGGWLGGLRRKLAPQDSEISGHGLDLIHDESCPWYMIDGRGNSPSAAVQRKLWAVRS